MLLTRRLTSAAAAVLLAVAATACSGDDSTAANSAPADGDGPVVVVTDMTYQPQALTVPAGTTVTWLFDDGAVRHDVAGDGFQSELLASGTFSHTFDAPGTYPYLCTVHPSMTGVVEVTG